MGFEKYDFFEVHSFPLCGNSIAWDSGKFNLLNSDKSAAGEIYFSNFNCSFD